VKVIGTAPCRGGCMTDTVDRLLEEPRGPRRGLRSATPTWGPAPCLWGRPYCAAPIVPARLRRANRAGEVRPSSVPLGSALYWVYRLDALLVSHRPPPGSCHHGEQGPE
jgi:hypothetical protein